MQLTKAKLTAAAGIICAGGLTLAAIGTGVGANFVKNATGNANIKVGTLDCRLANTSGSPYVTISNNGLTATVNLPEIESSAPGSSTAPVAVWNDGTMPLYVSWLTSTSGHIFDSGAVTAHPVANGDMVGVNATQSYNLGFDWTALNNADLGTNGTVTYTANCTDTRANLALYEQDGGTAAWGSNGDSILLGMPASPDANAGSGVQLVSPAATLPSTEPVFTTDNYNAGSPRWYIQFASGAYVFGYPTNAALGSNNWDEMGPGARAGYVNWSTVLADYSGTSVTGVNIVMDGDQTAVTDTISYIQYGGTVLLGS